MKTLRFLSFAAGLSLLFTACVGPAGPEGPQGNDGSNGVANINITVYQVQAWTASNPFTNYYYAAANDGAITDGTNDEVTATVSLNPATDGWQALPASNYLTPGDQVTYVWAIGQITFYYDDASAPSASDVYFNVAVIPPAIAKKYPNVNWKDAAAVATVPEYQQALKNAKHVTLQATANASVQSAK